MLRQGTEKNLMIKDEDGGEQALITKTFLQRATNIMNKRTRGAEPDPSKPFKRIRKDTKGAKVQIRRMSS